MTKLIQDTVGTDSNSDALEQAIFDQPKITKQIIKLMYSVTRVEFREKRDLFELLEGLVKIGLRGAKFNCEKVKFFQEISTINGLLLESIGELPGIVWQVNTKILQAVKLVKKYSNTMIAWTKKINEVVLSEDYAKKYY